VTLPSNAVQVSGATGTVFVVRGTPSNGARSGSAAGSGDSTTILSASPQASASRSRFTS